MYPLFTNMKYVFKKAYKYDKKIRLFLIVHIVCQILLPIISLVTTSGIVYMLTNNIDVIPYLYIVGGILLLSVILQITNAYVYNKYNWYSTFARTTIFMVEITNECITKDYETIEPKSGQKRLNQSLESVSSNWVGVEGMMKETPKFFINIIGL